LEAVDSPDAAAKVTSPQLRSKISDASEDFTAAMNDDFNTREALQVLFSVVRHANRYLDENETYDYRALLQALEFFDTFAGDVFGFEFVDSSDTNKLVDELLEVILSIRDDARDAGEYAKADALRETLESMGITVEDQENGVTYHR
jgi:cysteinyl-tRNA synthetase